MPASFYFIAGEKSGDLHGGKLMQAMREFDANFKAEGVGGSRMQAEGLKPILSFSDFQVMGFSDVIFALPRLIRHFYGLAKKILQDNPDAVIFIDYPGFNIRMAKYLRKKGYKGKLIHYIAPSVWAWGKGRIQTMSQSLDLLLTIYPFEPAYFEKGLKAIYVGNPLMEELSAPHNRKALLAIFPGSRLKEILRNLPLQIEAAKHFDKHVAISVSDPVFEKQIHALLKDVNFSYSLIPESDRFHLMQTASVALAKSGTVTLELALRGCPTVVLYQLTKINYLLAKYVFRISLPHYALPNILLKESLFPEHYQVKIDPKDLELSLIEQEKKHAHVQKKAYELKQLLTFKNASKEAAKEIFELCKKEKVH